MAERLKYKQRWFSALVETKMPLRLIDHAFHPISGIHMAEMYQKSIPNPDVILLDRIGHYPQVEAHQLVVEHLLNFLED